MWHGKKRGRGVERERDRKKERKKKRKKERKKGKKKDNERKIIMSGSCTSTFSLFNDYLMW
jgi:hypothetical protein